MISALPSPNPSSSSSSFFLLEVRIDTMFDHEKLDVYQIELAFVAWVTVLLTEVKEAAAGLHREVCDQLDRASLSALLNTAEGNGRRPGRQRAKFFDDARGSAVECAAGLDALVAKHLTSSMRIADGKTMLVRVVGMLTKLVERFEGDGYRVREDIDKTRIDFRSRPSSSLSPSHGKNPEEDGRARGGERG